MRKLLLILAFLFFAAEIGADRCFGQSWSGILSSSRAIDWSQTGLPNPLPDGEATANPWTPPVRTACTGTPSVTATGTSADATNIMNAVSKCGNGTYIMLHGRFSITADLRIGGSYTSGHNNVTLRGDGPMSTTLTVGAANRIAVGAGASGGSGDLTNLASNFTVGQTTFILENVAPTGLTTANINAGVVVGHFVQCNNGYTPSSRPLTDSSGCSGANSDPQTVFTCQGEVYCASNGSESNPRSSEAQTVRVTSATNNGNGTWTITTSPGLYMPDWSYARGATFIWNSTTYDTTGIGLEDMTIVLYDSGNNLEFGHGSASWIKGVRFIGYNNNGQLSIVDCWRCLVSNNYLFGNSATALGQGPLGVNLYSNYQGNSLVLNNIGDMSWFNDDDGGHNQAFVLAYNYSRDIFTGHYQATQGEHQVASNFILREGNQFGRINDDNTHGTHNFNTTFRNKMDCGDYPYQVAITGGGTSGQPGGGIQVGPFARFENVIGNVIGIGMPTYQLTNKCATYQIQAQDNAAFAVNGGGNGVDDPTGLTEASLVRWGNITTVQQSTDTPPNSGIRFVASENSNNANLSSWPNAVPYANMASPSTNLPCSLFMPNYTSTTCTPKYSGGTGLSWWKVCDTWTTFPTACSHYTTPPFPATGPDILASGGAPANYANDIPARIAWNNLPIDASFQNSYTVTASAWSSTDGGTETLTVTGLPTGSYTMGGFQLSGMPAGCTTGSNPANAELLMTSSGSGTISYALASNPGTNACNGTVKWPDVRQFDERVYASDSSGTGANPNPPTGLAATVQ